MDRAELFQELTRDSELAQDSSVQLHLVDLPVVHRSGSVGVRTVEILMTPRGDADCPWSAYVRVLSLEGSVVIENLKPLVSPIAHIHVPLGVGCDGVRGVELAGSRPSRTPRSDEFSVLIEFP